MSRASALVARRDAYLAATRQAERLRVAYLREIARERSAGRTLEDIGAELDLSRSRVCRLAAQADAVAE